MNTSYGLDTYRSHDLNIDIRTSSGDEIKLNFNNEQSASFRQTSNDNSSSTSLSYSSKQSFSFSIKSNGIDAQDQKEIDAFIKIAQPFIDDFIKELENDAPKSPVTKLAREIASIFDPNKPRDENNVNNVKNNIVKLFDNAISKLELPDITDNLNNIEEIFKQTQKLLEKTLKEFDEFNKLLYA